MTNIPDTHKPAIYLASPADTAEELFSQLLEMVEITTGRSLIEPINSSLNNASEALSVAFNELALPKEERTQSDGTLCHLVWSAYLKLETVKSLVALDYEQKHLRADAN